MKSIVVDYIHDDGLVLLQEFTDTTINTNITTEELQQELIDCDIMIGRTTPNTPRIQFPLLETTERLKVIGFASIGVDRVDFDYVNTKRVAIEHLPGINIQSVTEYAFALILALRRYVVSSFVQVKQGIWNKHGFMDACDLQGSTIGIIGLGNIGTNTARVARVGFGMEVLAYDPYLSQQECNQRGAVKCELEELLSKANTVVIHAPLTEETYHMIGEKELGYMNSSSSLINVGRGGIVDEAALYVALKNNSIKNAALDVQEIEPFYESPLLELDNFIATPHIAGLTKNYFEKAGIEIVRKCLLHVGVSESDIQNTILSIRKERNHK